MVEQRAMWSTPDALSVWHSAGAVLVSVYYFPCFSYAFGFLHRAAEARPEHHMRLSVMEV